MNKRILKIEASAGSGKTYRLTLEYLSKIFILYEYLKNSKFGFEKTLLNSILAITFTNKAANEMKERIIKRLKELSFSPSYDKDYLNSLKISTGLSEKKILSYSKDILEKIILDYSEFNVKTIDSLMSSIIKVISPEIGLEPNYEIMIDSSLELENFIKLFIDNYNKNELRDFFNSYISVEGEITNFNIDYKIIDQFKTLYNKVIHKEIDIKGDKAIEKIKQKMFSVYENSFMKNINKFISLIDENNGYINKQKINDTLIENLKQLSDDFDTKQNKGKIIFERLALLDQIINKSFFKKDYGEELLRKNTPEGIKNNFNKIYSEIKPSLSIIIESYSIIKISYFNKLFFNFAKEWNKKTDKIFVEEFSKTIKDKLKEWDKSAPPLLYLKLSDRFRNFLIDEFQDTSELQFKALSPIISETLSSEENSSLFIVGDRKQAIYRWRGGNAELMNLKNISNMIEKPIDDIKENSLIKNWRSDKIIVEFNNNFWSPDNISKIVGDNAANYDSLEKRIKENFKNSFQESKSEKEAGFVKIVFGHFTKDNDIEKEILKEKIKDFIYNNILKFIQKAIDKNFKLSDIAILVRKTSEGREIIDYLSKKGISAVSQESLFISSSPLIQEIISFLKFIEYPPDNLNFYNFISGEIFIKKASNIDSEYNPANFTKAIIGSKENSFYIVFRELYPKLWNSLIKPFFISSGFLPVYDIFQDITKIYELYENFETSHPFFISFAELLHNYEKDERNSISSFLEKWDEDNRGNSPPSIEIDDYGDSVNILTIHKSKGLEFPIVIVPLFDSSGGKGDNIYPDDDFIKYIKKDYTFVNGKLRSIYEDEINNSVIDNLNLMYVAFTRAINALFIPAIKVKSKNDKTNTKNYEKFEKMNKIIFYHPLFNEFEKQELKDRDEYTYEYGKLYKKEKADKKPLNRIQKPESKKLETIKWQKDFLIFKNEETLTSLEKQSTERGKKLHLLFQQIDKFKDKETALSIIKNLCTIYDIDDKDAEKISDFISNDNVFRFFSGDFQVFNEKEVAIVKDNMYEFKRIDRLLLYDDKFIVIDYKTGEHRKEHTEQVKEYINILREIYEGYDSEGYLLYIDTCKIKEVGC